MDFFKEQPQSTTIYAIYPKWLVVIPSEQIALNRILKIQDKETIWFIDENINGQQIEGIIDGDNISITGWWRYGKKIPKKFCNKIYEEPITKTF